MIPRSMAKYGPRNFPWMVTKLDLQQTNLVISLCKFNNRAHTFPVPKKLDVTFGQPTDMGQLPISQLFFAY